MITLPLKLCYSEMFTQLLRAFLVEHRLVLSALGVELTFICVMFRFGSQAEICGFKRIKLAEKAWWCSLQASSIRNPAACTGIGIPGAGWSQSPSGCFANWERLCIVHCYFAKFEQVGGQVWTAKEICPWSMSCREQAHLQGIDLERCSKACAADWALAGVSQCFINSNGVRFLYMSPKMVASW